MMDYFSPTFSEPEIKYSNLILKFQVLTSGLKSILTTSACLSSLETGEMGVNIV